MFWNKKVIKTFNTEETVELEGLEVWVVNWKSRHGSYSSDTRQRYQPFTNKNDAEVFAQSLRDAFKLIGSTAEARVIIDKQNNGLG